MMDATKIRGGPVDIFSEHHVIYHFYGPSGGVYGAIPRAVLTRWMSTDAYAQQMSGSVEDRQRRAVAALVGITRREKPLEDKDALALAAIQMFGQATDTLPRDLLPKIAAFIGIDGGKEAAFVVFTYDEQKEFTERWEELHALSVKEREGTEGTTTISVYET
jgi:hypothetical protein